VNPAPEKGMLSATGVEIIRLFPKGSSLRFGFEFKLSHLSLILSI